MNSGPSSVFLCSMTRLLAALLLLQMTATAQPKDTVIYVFDPMCGWCYGFDPVMENAASQYADRLHFQVISGGMITGSRQGIISPDFSQYILNTVPRLEQMTGVRFGEVYLSMLRNGTCYASSERPSRALVIFREKHPDKAIAFAHAMQRALFLDGMSLEEDATYQVLCGQFGIDADTFLGQLDSQDAIAAAEKDYALAQSLGVSGYPAVVGLKDGSPVMLASGYTDLKSLEQKLATFTR
jgi:putative protein-disulfide isomerase